MTEYDILSIIVHATTYILYTLRELNILIHSKKLACEVARRYV